MVISIIIEGGVLPNDNISAATMNNVESLRQSLHRIFEKVLSDQEDISIVINPQAGYKQAVKKYLMAGEDSFLFVDLDMPKTKKQQWFDNLANEPIKPISIPTEKKDNIFFMIQEMEAWILKQPDAIYRWATEYNNYLTKRTDKIEDHTMLRNRDVEDIAKPSTVLEKLITTFFEKNIQGRKTEKKRLGKVQYTKLKEGAELLDYLNVALLLAQDEELQRFRNTIITQ